MSSQPMPFVNKFPADSLEKQIYTFIDSLSGYIPVPNDRNRLSYSLFKYMNDEGDEPLISIKAAKLTVKGITEEDLAVKVTAGLSGIKNKVC